MFDHQHYVPILKAKRGEFRAIDEMNLDARSSLTPLFEIPFIQPYELEPIRPSDDPTTIESHLDKIARFVKSYWVDGMHAEEGADRPFFVDLRMLNIDECDDGTHPFVYFADLIGKQGGKLIPVTGLNRKRKYEKAVMRVAEMSGHGIMLRLTPADFEGQIVAEVDDFLSDHGLKPEDVHLLVDFESITEEEAQKIGATLLRVIGMVAGTPYLNDWKTFSFASSGFPETFPLSGDDNDYVPRRDWKLWRDLIGRLSGRIPTYADYGVRGRGLSAFNFPVQGAPKFAYTMSGRWLVSRRSRTSDNKNGTFLEIAKLLRQVPMFDATHCTGEADLGAYANTASDDGPGNSESWTFMSVNHHLSFTVDQIAKQFAP